MATAQAYTATTSRPARLGGTRCNCIRPAIAFLIAHEKAGAATSRSKTRFKVCSERQHDQDAADINSGFPAQLGLCLWCGRRTQPCGFIHSSTNEFVRPVHYRSFPEVIRQASHREDQQNSNCRIDFVGGIQERHLPYIEAVTQ